MARRLELHCIERCCFVLQIVQFWFFGLRGWDCHFLLPHLVVMVGFRVLIPLCRTNDETFLLTSAGHTHRNPFTLKKFHKTRNYGFIEK
jgi:hypothetical protein